MDSPPLPPAPTLASWAGFLAMCLGMFMAILDIQVVITSLTVIDRALGIGADRMSWVQTAYLVTEIIAIPLTAFLTRLFTMRLVFAGAIAGFVLASIACALSQGFVSLIAARAVQGFAGGLLIPLVFSGIFFLFPVKGQTLATAFAGVSAVLAPTLGPFAGGWLTENFSWHWLFLINIAPGFAAMAAGLAFLPRPARGAPAWRRVDGLGLLILALCLGAFQIVMKEAPQMGWSAAPVAGLAGLSAAAALFFVFWSLKRDEPLVRLELYGERAFAAGCALSFMLGLVLYGSVYLLPVFLALVREMGPLAIGEFMLVAGAAQLLAAPVAVLLERRMDARVLSAFGFLAFAAGLWLNSHSTNATGFGELLWPQAIRGAAVMFCILPPTRIALGLLAPERVNDGSSLYNLMRNIGGAVGIALIDTMIFTRAPVHAEAIAEKLRAGDPALVAEFGVSPADFEDGADPMTLMGVMSDIEEAALVLVVNEAWTVLAYLSAAAVLALLVTGKPARAAHE